MAHSIARHSLLREEITTHLIREYDPYKQHKREHGKCNCLYPVDSRSIMEGLPQQGRDRRLGLVELRVGRARRRHPDGETLNYEWGEIDVPSRAASNVATSGTFQIFKQGRTTREVRNRPFSRLTWERNTRSDRRRFPVFGLSWPQLCLKSSRLLPVELYGLDYIHTGV